mgnify:FL=1|tara:strand:+ start:1984 stop:2721 length:738 start_codon:yes stop_codon:yes gene_type:complete
MAYNAVSGTLIAAQEYIPGDLIVGNIVSGNLSTSDGASIINVPRVSNATDNSLLSNVGGDANTLTCESNLTFNGTSNVLNVVGSVTASVSLSASFIYGDGSALTNLPSGGATAAGPVYSLQLHNADNDLTGSANLLFQSDILKMSCGLKLNRTSISATYTASLTDYYIGVDSTGGTISLRLPDASVMLSGQTYVVKDEGGVSNTNAITILASGSQTIDGQNQVLLQSPYAALSLYCNGTNKYFIC